MRCAALFLSLLLLTVGTSAAAVDQQAAASQIRAMTGAPVRLTWCRSTDGRLDYLGPIFKDQMHPAWVVMVFDTDEGRERVFAPASTPDAYCEPLITPNGKRLIWSRRGTDVMIADWSGANPHLFCNGIHAMAVAEDPPGTEWVYVGQDPDSRSGSPKSIVRYQIDNPSVSEVVWNKTTIGMRLEVSRDGKWAVGEWGGNSCGLASWPNGNLKIFGQGCNTGMAFDSDMHVWNMLGGHRGIQLEDNGGSNGRFISFDGAPGRDGANVEWWCPSAFHWDGRFLSFTGPWKGPRNQHGNVIVAQFSDDYRSMKQYIRVTDIPQSEIYLYAWIAPPGFSASASATAAPSIAAGLDIKLLTSDLKRLDRPGAPLKPILDELKRLAQDADAAKAREAQTLVARIDQWQHDQLQQAATLETKDPDEAEKIYKDLLARCPGLDTDKSAQQRLTDKTFQADLRAWAQFRRIQLAEKRLQDVPGAEHSAADPKFARVNSMALGQIRTIAQTLARQGPSPWLLTRVNADLITCGLPKLEGPATAPSASGR